MMFEQQHQKSTHDENNDQEIDYNVLARMELLRLQRQYRLSEGTEHSIAEESGTTISRQFRMLKILRKEKDDLETDLENVSSAPNKRLDEQHRKHMADLMDKYDKYQNDMKHAMGEINEIEHQVDKITQRIVDQKLKIISLFGQSRTPAMAEKKLGILENRLYHKTTLYDTLMAKNRQLRADINDILMDRGKYHRRMLFNKQNIRKLKLNMIDEVDKATALYEARDESVQKMKTIREKDEKDGKLHVNELKELLRLQHNDEKIHRFMKKKSLKREELEGDTARNDRHNKQRERELDIMLYSYKKTFKSIATLGLSQDVDILCYQYHEHEQQNFSWFKNLCEANNEIEAIRECVKLLKEEIEQIKKSQDIEEEVSQNLLLMKQKLSKDIKDSLEHVESSLEETQSNLDEYMQGLLTIFNFLGCVDAFKHFLGNREGVRPDIIPILLQLLDRKLDELNFKYATYDLRKSVELDGGHLFQVVVKTLLAKDTTKYTNSGGPFKPKVVIAGRLDVTDDGVEEDDKYLSQRPLTRKEIKRMIMDKVATNESTAKDAHPHLHLHLNLSDSETTITRNPSAVTFPIKHLRLSKPKSNPGGNNDDTVSKIKFKAKTSKTKLRGESLTQSHQGQEDPPVADETSKSESPPVVAETTETQPPLEQPTTNPATTVEDSSASTVPTVEEETNATESPPVSSSSPPNADSSANDPESKTNREDP